ncbi:MAG: lipopolysaccharide heptosyltransferase II [Planctomycetota bacterium]|nr:MAG: lipopolysaccharide heptosyltransferase II [Planctomycetota bacterium]
MARAGAERRALAAGARRPMSRMRLLVRIPNWVGDVVMASAALRTLRRRLPEAHITLWGKPALLAILRDTPWYDEQLVWPEAGAIAAARAVRGRGYTHALLLTHSWSSAIAAWLGGIPQRIGHRNDGRELLLTRALPLERRGRIRPVSAVLAYLALCEAMGCRVERSDRAIELPVTEQARARTRAWDAERGLLEGPAPVVCNVGAGFGRAKQWPAERWAALADRLVAGGRRVVVYGGPKDRAAVEAVLAASRAAARGAVVAGLGVPIGDLAAHMARAALAITTDSGGRHFPVAVGTPTIVLMGPNHPELSESPGNLEHYVVLLTRPPCWPCHLRECPIDHRCMREIETETVARFAEGWLAGRRPFGHAAPWRTPPGREHRLFRGACT